MTGVQTCALPIYGKIITYVASRFGFLNNLLTFLPVQTVFEILVPVGLILGVGIGYIGSKATVHKHINV